MASNELEVKIGADIDSLLRELNKAKRGMTGFENRVGKMTDRLKSSGKRFRAVGLSMSKALTLPLGIAGGAVIKMASDFEESLNKVDVAFKNSSGEVRNFAKTSLKSFGIAEGTALDMAALFGDMATSMGVATNDASKLSTELVGLAGDLSSFKNINIEEVTTALNGVFTGETESLKRLGIVMTETNLKQFALSKGMSDNLKTMSQAEKVQLRYAFILEKTKNAQGDFARTSGGSANQMRIFQESIKELSVSFGRLILPLFTKLITKANKIISVFANLNDHTKKIIIAVSGFVAVLPLAITLIGGLITALSAVLTPVGLVIASIVALGVAVYKNFDTIVDNVASVYNSFVDLYNQSTLLRGVISGIGTAFKIVWISAELYLSNIWAFMKSVGNNILNLWGGVGKVLAGALTFDIDKIKEGLQQAKTAFVDGFSEVQKEVKENNEKAGKDIATALTNGINETISGELEKTTPEKLKEGLSTMAESVSAYATQVGAKIASSLGLGFSGGGEGGGESGGSEGGGSEGGGESGGTGNLSSLVSTETNNTLNVLKDFGEQAKDVINNGILDTFSNMAESIGAAFGSGQNAVKMGGNAILSSLGGILVQFGKLVLATGLASEAFKKAITNPFGGGIGAIIAGASLIAIGGAMKGFASKQASKGSGGSGGYSGSSASGFQGSTGSNSAPRSSTSSRSVSSSSSLQNVVFNIEGTKLVGVLSNTLSRNRQLAGTLKIG